MIDHVKKKNGTPPSKSKNFGAKYGAAMIAVMPKGQGEVFNARTAIWINGLRDVDFYTQQITRNVLARAATNEPGRGVYSSIGLARPSDPSMYGYISEHHGHGMTQQQSGDYAEDLAASMLAFTLGIEFDPDVAWNERRRATSASLRNPQPRYTRPVLLG